MNVLSIYYFSTHCQKVSFFAALTNFFPSSGPACAAGADSVTPATDVADHMSPSSERGAQSGSFVRARSICERPLTPTSALGTHGSSCCCGCARLCVPRSDATRDTATHQHNGEGPFVRFTRVWVGGPSYQYSGFKWVGQNSQTPAVYM